MSDKLSLADPELRTIVTFLDAQIKTAGRFAAAANPADKLIVLCDNWWLRLNEDDQEGIKPEYLGKKLKLLFIEADVVMSHSHFISLLCTVKDMLEQHKIYNPGVAAIIDRHTSEVDSITVGGRLPAKYASGTNIRSFGSRYKTGPEEKRVWGGKLIA